MPICQDLGGVLGNALEASERVLCRPGLGWRTGTAERHHHEKGSCWERCRRCRGVPLRADSKTWSQEGTKPQPLVLHVCLLCYGSLERQDGSNGRKKGHTRNTAVRDLRLQLTKINAGERGRPFWGDTLVSFAPTPCRMRKWLLPATHNLSVPGTSPPQRGVPLACWACGPAPGEEVPLALFWCLQGAGGR